MNDPPARRARTFQCRDALWESLEQIASELECSIDYLVNDALKHYVRARLTRHPQPATGPLPSLPVTPSGQYQIAPPPPPMPPYAPRLQAPLPPPSYPVPPVAPPPLWPARMTPPPPPPARPLLPPCPPPGFAAPPPLPARLEVSYGDRSCVVEGPRFVIGRGKAAGLAIKDPNISREHAVVEQEGGRYFLVDQRSTNGTLVNGQRITRREIADGDVAIICEHQVRFSFTRQRG